MHPLLRKAELVPIIENACQGPQILIPFWEDYARTTFAPLRPYMGVKDPSSKGHSQMNAMRPGINAEQYVQHNGIDIMRVLLTVGDNIKIARDLVSVGDHASNPRARIESPLAVLNMYCRQMIAVRWDDKLRKYTGKMGTHAQDDMAMATINLTYVYSKINGG